MNCIQRGRKITLKIPQNKRVLQKENTVEQESVILHNKKLKNKEEKMYLKKLNVYCSFGEMKKCVRQINYSEKKHNSGFSR